MDADFLRYEQTGAIVTLTMQSPATRNALTGNTAADELAAACRRIDEDASVNCVILTGDGPAFSSGGDLKQMQQMFDHTPAQLRQWYRHGVQRLALAVYNLEVPIIAAVNGPAIGAGCDLSCMADIRIAAESASFAESFLRVGLIPGDGGAWLLPRVVGMSKASEMTFTGDALDARQALACGLVSQVVPDPELMPAARALAERIARQPGTGLRLAKRLLREGQHMRFEGLLELSAGFQSIAHKTAEHVAAIDAFVSRRKPSG